MKFPQPRNNVDVLRQFMFRDECDLLKRQLAICKVCSVEMKERLTNMSILGNGYVHRRLESSCWACSKFCLRYFLQKVRRISRAALEDFPTGDCNVI